MTPSAPSRRVWILRLATVGAGTALGLMLAGFLFHRFRHKPTPEDDYGAAVLGPCYRIDGDRLVRIVPPHRHGPLASEFPLAKAPGTRRIAVVGESTGEMLERAMADLVSNGGCRDKIEVLECSTFGAAPELAVRRAEEAVRYSPDVLVVAIGHNFRNELPNAAHDASGPAWDHGSWSAWGDVPPRARDAYQRIFDVAQPRGVQVLALLLASNLRYRPESDAEYLSSRTRAVAWVRWAHGNLPGAIAALSDSATPDTRLQAYERAGFHAEAGEWAAARDDFKRARDLDFCLPNQPPGACAFRASSAENAAIADEVRKSGGIVVDADAVFAEQLPHGIVEWETMWDYCHPNGEPLDFLARRILTLGAPAAASCVAHAPAPSEGTAFSADSLYRRLAAPVETLFDGNPRKLGWEVFADNSGWRHRVDGIITLLQRRFPDQAMTLVAQYDRDAASTYDPASHAAALDAIADAARDEGRLDIARWCLERSVAVSPAVPALVDLSLVHLRLQDETAARADLEQALKLEPDSAQAANVREAMLGETSAPPHAGEDVPVRATPPG